MPGIEINSLMQRKSAGSTPHLAARRVSQLGGILASGQRSTLSLLRGSLLSQDAWQACCDVFSMLGMRGSAPGVKRTPMRLRCLSGHFWRAALLLIVVLLAACTPQQTTTSASLATPTPTATIAATRSQPTPPSPAPTPAFPSEGAITLTWWAPDFLSTQVAQPIKESLEAQLAAFERTYAGQVQIRLVPKARYGRGGLLDLFRAAQPVAPAILPDLVTLDVFELEQAASAGLLQPLDQLLAEDVIQQLYPFARSAGQFQGRLLAVQYLADFEHIAYLANAVPVPPQTWDELLRSGATPYLFPLGAPQPGANTSRFRNLQCVQLSHYLSAGASLNPTTRRLTLDETSLLRLLTFYKTASDAGLLPPNALEINSTDIVWTLFAQGRIPLAQVTARQYLAGGSSVGTVGYAATPGWAGPASPVAAGWALAIGTTNPRRQQLAADLIAWLLEPERASAMARATGWLPTSSAALDIWGEQPYYTFLDQQLAGAVSPPAGLDYAQTSSQLQKAVIAVLAEGVSPRDATTAALGTAR